ncbi:MAG: insulinase family protein [Lachnospiraceae bacterium]|jgi:Zn-dependent M16 (insulinase) family peptidase|nr:insulinase family protein [Lachnospiraceae bacterium]
MSYIGLDAYELINEENLDDIHAKGAFLKHKKTGAQVILLQNDDENKAFYIGFRTPPHDSTGLPHILEHSVLCGSKKFPVKEPFIELAKGSLNTFLNAITFPDRTLYPVASTNDKDFKNLMHVYMDAVFCPQVYEKKEVFMQEGWNYHLEDIDGEITYNGVVYNEMKGAYSNPENVLDRFMLKALFPDTPYRHDSGGDPEMIPHLTYEEFLDFHAKYYHPSNSYIYLYGDFDAYERLKWLDDEYLSSYDATKVDSAIPLQKPFEAVSEIEIPYPISAQDTEEENTYLAYSKVIGNVLDRELFIAYNVLDYALLSAPGAPLKKALIDAGIGKDVYGSYDGDLYQPVFTVVSKNAESSQKEKFNQIIEDVLKEQIKNGIDRQSLEAGIHTIEFRYREADFGSFPKGLAYGMQVASGWIYDNENPLKYLEALKILDELKNKIGTGYFEELIKQYLLDNKHGALITVYPKQGLTMEADAHLREELSQYKKTLGQEELEALVRTSESLTEYQLSPDSEEALLTIPLLEREDLTKEVSPIIYEECQINGIKTIFHEVETNGIGYIRLLFETDKLESKDLPYLGILQESLGVIDTNKRTYQELNNDIAAKTGGIDTSLDIFQKVEDAPYDGVRPMFEIKAKALYDKLPEAMSFISEIVLQSKLSDTKRLKEMLDMEESDLSTKFPSAGHRIAVTRARSYASVAAAFQDGTDGVAYYDKVCEIIDSFETEKDNLVNKLKELSEQIFCSEKLLISFTGTKEGFSKFKEAVMQTIADFPKGKAVETKELKLPLVHKNEGFKTAAKVQYVAQAGNFLEDGIPYTGALHVLRTILAYDYLWQQVRVVGGAYGCMCAFNRAGNASFVSYRDPHLRRTLDVYKNVIDYVRTFSASEREMTKYIIGAINEIDQPLTPAMKGERSLNLYLNGITPELLKKEREEILNVTQEDIHKLDKILQSVINKNRICVIGGEEQVEKEAEIFDEVRSL